MKIVSIQDNNGNQVEVDLKEFINHIYDGLHEVFKKDDILPQKTTFNNLNDPQLNKIKLGDPVIYDL